VHVSALAVYPVKSTAGLDVPAALVHPWGFDRDRRWMVVDADGTTVTARTHRRLLHVTATPQPDEAIVLSAPGRASLAVAAPHEGEPVPLSLSRVDCGLAAAAAGDWLSDHLGEQVRLVWLDDPRRRTVAESHGGQPGDTMAFADAGPVLLASTTSLARLDEWLRETAHDAGEAAPDPLPMVRFRPNIVVDGPDEPFAEDDWKRVRVGDVEMRFSEHCDRCVLPTIDPVTLTSSKEPMRTLALHRQWDHAVFFGVRTIPLTSGVVRVGDEVVPY
jgi:uncharacterized protein